MAVITICLSFAAGAMLYIVSGELIPESNKLYKGRMSAIDNMIIYNWNFCDEIIKHKIYVYNIT